jgi:hypothetical protein
MDEFPDLASRARRYFSDRCLSSVPRAQDGLPKSDTAPCVLLTIGALESGSRPRFEREAEVVVAKLASFAAWMRKGPIVPDLSVGPFQIKPSSVRTLDSSSGYADQRALVAALCRWTTAAEVTRRQLEAQFGRGITCTEFLAAWQAHKGGPLTGIECDVAHLVHAGVHRKLDVDDGID